MISITDEIAALTAQLKAQRKGTLLDRLRETNRPRPNFDHLNDPNLWTRLNAKLFGTVEGHDDDAPKAVPVKPKRKRSRPIFTERDVMRAVSGHLKAGLAVAGTKFVKDGFVVLTGKPEAIDLAPSDEPEAEAENEWDRI